MSQFEQLCKYSLLMWQISQLNTGNFFFGSARFFFLMHTSAAYSEDIAYVVSIRAILK